VNNFRVRAQREWTQIVSKMRRSVGDALIY
jgi:hypothetical protein